MSSRTVVLAIDMRRDAGQFAVGNDRHIDVFCVAVAKTNTGFALSPVLMDRVSFD